jgi:hypothetical protein
MISEIIGQFYTDERPVEPEEDERAGNKYCPKYIARLLTRKGSYGKASFYFQGRRDHLTVSSNGHLNVRGEEEMFKVWGKSEFRNLKPRTVFEELEREITKINVTSVSDSGSHSFASYGDFIGWLTHRSDGKGG